MSSLLNFDFDFDYEWTKQSETAGFDENFINEIYDMPKNEFMQNVLKHTLPEMNKLPIPEGTRFPVTTTLNSNMLEPVKLVRQLTDVPDTFHEWLYQFRFMLQYFTIEEMFDIFHLYDFAYGVNEPNAWVDAALEKMYVDTPESEEPNVNATQQFEFNLNWDIEKGNFENPEPAKLSLFLTEEVGIIEDEFNEYTSYKNKKCK